MTKNEAIRTINYQLGASALGIQNTHWSNVVTYGSAAGWWLNIPFHKFRRDLHLILNLACEGKFIHIKVPADAIPAPDGKFRNKNESADIFMPSSGRARLVDMQSGSARHDFGQYQANEHKYR